MKYLRGAAILLFLSHSGRAAPQHAHHVEEWELPPDLRDSEAITDHYLFDLSLAEFMMQRKAKIPPDLSWKSHACSGLNHPMGHDFKPACHRHNFGLENYILQGRLTLDAKAFIDGNFWLDLLDQCKRDKTPVKCKSWAESYYFSAKSFPYPYTQLPEHEGSSTE